MRLISMKEVKEKVGLSHVTIYKRMREGDFPLPRRDRRHVAWVESEVDQWINDTPVATYLSKTEKNLDGTGDGNFKQ